MTAYVTLRREPPDAVLTEQPYDAERGRIARRRSGGHAPEPRGHAPRDAAAERQRRRALARDRRRRQRLRVRRAHERLGARPRARRHALHDARRPRPTRRPGRQLLDRDRPRAPDRGAPGEPAVSRRSSISRAPSSPTASSSTTATTWSGPTRGSSASRRAAPSTPATASSPPRA